LKICFLFHPDDFSSFSFLERERQDVDAVLLSNTYRLQEIFLKRQQLFTRNSSSKSATYFLLSYLRHRRSSSERLYFVFFTLSLFLLLTMTWICAPLVISDSHRHLEIRELRPRVNGRIIALKYTLEVTETENSVKAPRLFSCVKTPLRVSSRIDRGTKTPPLLSVFLVYHIPEIDRAHYCTRNLSTPRFPLLSIKLSLSLSYVSCHLLVPLSYVYACSLSPSLVSSAHL